MSVPLGRGADDRYRVNATIIGTLVLASSFFLSPTLLLSSPSTTPPAPFLILSALHHRSTWIMDRIGGEILPLPDEVTLWRSMKANWINGDLLRLVCTESILVVKIAQAMCVCVLVWVSVPLPAPLLLPHFHWAAHYICSFVSHVYGTTHLITNTFEAKEACDTETHLERGNLGFDTLMNWRSLPKAFSVYFLTTRLL